MFNIGDKIVYPLHGAGKIKAIEKKEILGEVKSYYILYMPIGKMEISIPIDKIKDMGIRAVVGDDIAEKVIELLEDKSSKMSDNWGERYKDNLNKIKSGDIFEIAEVVRNLALREEKKGLSTGEKKMLSSAKKMLVSEFLVVWDKEVEIVERILNKAIYNLS